MPCLVASAQGHITISAVELKGKKYPSVTQVHIKNCTAKDLHNWLSLPVNVKTCFKVK